MKHLIIFIALTLPLYAESGHEGHEHSHEHAEKLAGPNGGRRITSIEPHLEILLRPDRFLQISVLSEANTLGVAGEQQISLIGGDRMNPVRMSFAINDGVWVSNRALPEGNGLPVVLQIKPSPEAKTVIEKFYLNLNKCGSCNYKEYACICEH